MNQLLQIGFTPTGNWNLDQQSIYPTLNQYSDRTNLIYCFVVDGVPKYFGITRNSLETRMRQYSRPGNNQSTNIRVNQLIRESLAAESTIEIYVFLDNGLVRYGTFAVNLALGLEETLINAYQTEWNHRGIRRIVEIQNPDIEIEINAQDEEITETFYPIEFSIDIVETYRKNGFINIPAAYSDSFPSDGSYITVNFSNNQLPALVDRKNNNGYPRLRVGLELKNWILTLPTNQSMLFIRKSNNEVSIS